MASLRQLAREIIAEDRRHEHGSYPEPVQSGLTGMYTWESIRPFVVAQTERNGRKFFLTESREPDTDIDPAGSVEHVSYRLFVEPVHPGDLYENIGQINLALFKNRHVAQIYGVNLVEEFQHQGLGTFMYKVAINDLVSEGWKVQSDSARSPQANRLWLNLQQKNPDAIKVIPLSERRTLYEVRGVVHRRPKKPVRRHRRSK